MAKRNSEVNPFIKKLIEDNDIKSAGDAQMFMKDIFKDMVNFLMKAEFDESIGYGKYERESEPESTNYRNGYNTKNVNTSLGKVQIEVPRDREGKFEPQIVPKHSRDISDMEDKIISMYGRGMTISEINSHLEDIYGLTLSSSQISRITDKVFEELESWKNRPLKACYPFVFMDAIHFNVKTNGKILNRAAYVILGIDTEGKKDILSIVIGENESSKFWLKVVDELRNRGVEEIFSVSIDGLIGFSDAILTIYPQTKIQRCIVHQIRNTLKYMNYKDRKYYAQKLKNIYNATNEMLAYEALEALKEEHPEYAPSLRGWYNNWAELSYFFNFPLEIRKLIYTTNIIESLNSQFRKVSNSRSIYPTEDSLLKVLYLASKNITKKWSQKIRNWEKILRILVIEYGDRLEKYL
ncbi:MAG: IS256 family transposase [Fusobacteriaceae bacterium]